VRHLYVHIPFCARICPYCAFYKERADPSQTQRFCEALLRELGDVSAKFPIDVDTIFFGGGTPTALTSAQLEFLLNGFRERLDLSRLTEWTFEANPGSVSERKAAVLRAFGINRISLGVQSWDDNLLQVLGREHNAAQAEESYRIMRAAGFRSVSVDLMFGLPGQSLTQWEGTLAHTVALQPDHISAYCLTYEEDTEFFARQTRGEYREDPGSDAQFFESSMRILEGAGYRQYEISNYARPGYESVHNRGYWAGADYHSAVSAIVSVARASRYASAIGSRSFDGRKRIER
jgi:oxygen-independent coproporphyrinogen-3 oxidase